MCMHSAGSALPEKGGKLWLLKKSAEHPCIHVQVLQNLCKKIPPTSMKLFDKDVLLWSRLLFYVPTTFSK